MIAKKTPPVDVSKHILVPKHTKLSDKAKKELLETYKITLEELPRIYIKDPALENMDLTTDDVIMVERPSSTAKVSKFYRRVVK